MRASPAISLNDECLMAVYTNELGGLPVPAVLVAVFAEEAVDAVATGEIGAVGAGLEPSAEAANLHATSGAFEPPLSIRIAELAAPARPVEQSAACPAVRSAAPDVRNRITRRPRRSVRVHPHQSPFRCRSHRMRVRDGDNAAAEADSGYSPRGVSWYLKAYPAFAAASSTQVRTALKSNVYVNCLPNNSDCSSMLPSRGPTPVL